MRLNWISLNKEIQWYRWLKQLKLHCAHQHDEILSCDMGSACVVKNRDSSCSFMEN